MNHTSSKRMLLRGLICGIFATAVSVSPTLANSNSKEDSYDPRLVLPVKLETCVPGNKLLKSDFVVIPSVTDIKNLNKDERKAFASDLKDSLSKLWSNKVITAGLNKAQEEIDNDSRYKQHDNNIISAGQPIMSTNQFLASSLSRAAKGQIVMALKKKMEEEHNVTIMTDPHRFHLSDSGLCV